MNLAEISGEISRLREQLDAQSAQVEALREEIERMQQVRVPAVDGDELDEHWEHKS